MVDVEDKLRTHLWPTLLVNWQIWPAAQVINFNYVPLRLRVLWLNS